MRVARGGKVETKLLSIKEAAKHFNFPVHKLYQLVRERKCPFIEIETISGNIKQKINTKTFPDCLDEKARNKEVI